MCLNELEYSLSLPGGSSYSTIPEFEPVNLFYYCEVFKAPAKLSFSEKRSFLGVCFNLGRAFEYSFTRYGLPAGVIRKNEYAFVYLPEENCEYNVGEGTIITFRFNFSLSFLKKCSEVFPVLNQFLQKVERNEPCTMTPSPLVIPESVLEAIKAILFNSHTHVFRDDYFSSRVMDILTFCLQQITVSTGFSNQGSRVHEPVEILEVNKYIATHLQDSLSLGLIADHVGLEPRTLSRKFKKVHHTSVMNFLFEERMKKAVALLRDSDKKITQIAIAVGYKNISNFTEAFTRRFGYPPSTLRQSNRKGDIDCRRC
jgi:AraC family transcriptional regulator, transcriptional activator of the genes for pyochelin and ferripyochelin receptors